MDLPPDTYRVSALAGEIQALLQGTYPSVWVVGEIQRLNRARSGHAYFDLVEKGDDHQVVGRLSAVVWRGDLERIRRTLEGDDGLAEEREIRCRVNLDVYPPQGRLQVVIRDVDPNYTLGSMARRRQEVLAELARRGLMERNGELRLSTVPLEIGLVTSPESAAYYDFLSTLGDGPYGFRVHVAGASVQGAAAESEVAAAVRELGTRDLDCVAVVRGGGSKSDLAAFDTLGVARAVAECPLPVITGLGHEIDEAVADLVAHTPARTPTGAAEYLVQRVATAEARLGEAARALGRGALERVWRAEQRLERLEASMRSASARLTERSRSLERLRLRLTEGARRRIESAASRRRRAAARLGRAAPTRVTQASHEVERAVSRLGDLSGFRVREASAEVEALSRLVRELSPQRVLERGYSVTRDRRGRLVRRPQDVRAGDTLSTRLAEGEVTSRVEPQQLDLLS